MTAGFFPKSNIAGALAEQIISEMADRNPGAKNRYEAAEMGNPRRSYIPAFVRDARYDINSWSRWEICRKIRYFERNTWLVPAIKKTHVKYTAGNGLPIKAASSDSEWNKRADEYYAECCESPCVDSTLNMDQCNQLIAGEDCIDGAVFIVKTRRMNDDGKMVPAIQLIESHRCSSPGITYGKEDQFCADGVQLSPDNSGRPIGYWLRDKQDQNAFDTYAWTLKPVRSVIHVFKPERVGQYREISDFAATLNTLHDLDDLTILEMDRAKNNSKYANIITTWNGEAPNAMDARRSRLGIGGIPAGSTDETIEKRIAQYQQILGAGTTYIKPGEKFEQFGNENPSAATQWYWRFLISQICAAKDVPLLVILPESMQGTTARGVIQDANISFRMAFRRYGTAAKKVRNHFVDWGRFNDPRLYDAPHDWWKCHVIPPQALDVDTGRNSAAMLAEIKEGAKSYDDIADEDGTTSDERFRRKARNIGQVKKIAIEESEAMGVKINPSDIVASLVEIENNLRGGEGEKTEDFTRLKSEMDAYGVGVRAGSLTPTITDENHFRAKAGLPPVTAEIRDQWKRDGGVRRPITLSTPDAESGKVMPETETELAEI